VHPNRNTSLGLAVLVAAVTVLGGCQRGVSTGTGTAPGASTTAGCPASVAGAKSAVRQAERTAAPWNGPTSGPPAVSGKTIVYVAQTMTNPGVAGAANGVIEAGKAIGWTVRVIDGQGTPVGIQAAFSEAVDLKPSGMSSAASIPN